MSERRAATADTIYSTLTSVAGPTASQRGASSSRSSHAAQPAARRALRIAYLVSEYPKASHSFVRRELLELERRSHHILRLSIRHSPDAIADEQDRIEDQRTIHCLSQSRFTLIAALFAVALTRPVRFIAAVRCALQMSRNSERGLFRHFAYLVEASFLVHVLKRHEIQHVHVHFAVNSAAVGLLIHALGGPPFSVTVHGPVEFDGPIGLSLERKLIAARFIIAISHFCVSQIKRWLPLEHWHKIHIVRCTVDDSFFAPAPPAIESANRTFLCIGRLSAQKGQFTLIEAVDQLRTRSIHINLILAGDGELRDQLQQRIHKLQLQDRITVTGWQDEASIRQHIINSRAVVQPSYAEGLPVAIMEALALARPVITTTVAGIPELVRENENGWLVTPGCAKALAQAMQRALETPASTLNQMGLAGRERVRTFHNTRTEVNTLEAILLNNATASTQTHHSRGGRH